MRYSKPDEILTKEEMKIFRKYVGKLNWLAVYVMNLARRQKKAALKNLRDVNRILKKVEEKDNKVTFGKVSRKEDLCVI